jgi:hypothetical protein
MSSIQHDLTTALMADGWAGLDVDPNTLSEQAQRQAERFAMEALANGTAVLETEDGRRLLMSLVRDILLSPPSDLERQPEHALWHAGRRVGQQEVVWMLLNAVNAVRALTGRMEG